MQTANARSDSVPDVAPSRRSQHGRVVPSRSRISERKRRRSIITQRLATVHAGGVPELELFRRHVIPVCRSASAEDNLSRRVFEEFRGSISTGGVAQRPSGASPALGISTSDSSGGISLRDARIRRHDGGSPQQSASCTASRTARLARRSEHRVARTHGGCRALSVRNSKKVGIRFPLIPLSDARRCQSGVRRPRPATQGAVPRRIRAERLPRPECNIESLAAVAPARRTNTTTGWPPTSNAPAVAEWCATCSGRNSAGSVSEIDGLCN